MPITDAEKLGNLPMSTTISWVKARGWLDHLQGRTEGRSVGEALLPLLSAPWLPLFDRQLLGWILSMSEGVEGAPADLVHIDHWYPGEAEAVNAMPTGGYVQLIDDVAAHLWQCHPCTRRQLLYTLAF